MKDSIKRTLDVFFSLLGLMAASPVLAPILLVVWLQDFHSPFYVSSRVGKRGRSFKFVKIRSMVKDAEKAGVDSTAADDKRITAVGYFIRRFKLDELAQLWNVLKGEMSLVGPRPNVERASPYLRRPRRNSWTYAPESPISPPSSSPMKARS
jgi:lipopolysaccharide/colanic/teichoic acid biosynthesis glycosyltransferase